MPKSQPRPKISPQEAAMTDQQSAKEDRPQKAEPEIDSQQLWKLLVELGPLIVFFIVTKKWFTGK
jgi:hypothetical protein